MSQHYFQFGLFHTLCGWDRDRLGFFLVIGHEGIPNPLYSNLAEDYPECFDELAQVLPRFGIEMPHGLFDALTRDKAKNMGNRVTNW